LQIGGVFKTVGQIESLSRAIAIFDHTSEGSSDYFLLLPPRAHRRIGSAQIVIGANDQRGFRRRHT
jgi:hypothetical protein